MHEGHRQRILERVAKGDVLEDHELVEILLFNPVARKNTNEIAHRLLERFGTLQNIFKADVTELEEIEGVGKTTALYLKTVAQLVGRMREEGAEAPRIYNYRTFSEYVATRYRGFSEEYLDIFCLDAQFRIVFNARFCTHQSDRVRVSLEEIARVVSVHRPSGIVISHNHPYGTSAPSEEDRKFTAQIQTLCNLYKTRLFDHIIVGQDSTYSFFFNGEIGGGDRLLVASGSPAGKKSL